MCTVLHKLTKGYGETELTLGLPMSTCGCHILAIYEWGAKGTNAWEKKKEKKESKISSSFLET